MYSRPPDAWESNRKRIRPMRMLRDNKFDKAKRRANERLTGWITDIRQENDSGIPKLRREFRHAFKKIEYVPPKNLKIEDGKERILQRELDEKKQSDVDDDPSKSRVLDDIHDSNSSNLSSRLENIRDELRISESRTPYNKTPMLLADNAERKESCVNDQSKAGNSQTILKAFLKKGSGKRRPDLLPGALPGIASFQRKRRKRTFQKQKSDIAKSDVFAELDEAPGEQDTFQERSESHLSIASMVRRSSSVLSSGQRTAVKPYKLSKGPVDLLLRRAIRQNKKHQPSKHELPTVMAELTSEEKHQEILSKFRRCVRQLIHVRVLLNVSRLRIEEEEKSKGFKRFDGGMELSFDVSMFKCAVSYSGITSRARQALKKNPGDRTEEDAKILLEVLLRLPMFMKYPKAVKRALARMIWYDTFEEGRVIVKQGDPGTRMYFVISGEVDLTRTDSADTEEEICYHLRTVQAGATFGELALIRNMKREFTAVCRGTSEFLSLSKDEFNHALRSRWERDCNKRFNFLRNCEHFTTWTDKQLQICADSSELREYVDNSVIIGDIDGPTENVYFIRNGKCEIVRRILVVRHQSPYQRPNILLPQTARRRPEFLNKIYCRDRRIDREETRFLTVTSLHPGNYFGVGENLRDTFILSRGKTELLIINSAQFSIQGKSEQLRRLQQDRESSIPSNKALYKKFQENRKWFEYRNKLLQDIVVRKPKPYCTSQLDVPRSILTAPTIPKDIVFYNRKYC